MALPMRVPPPGTPPFMAAGHSIVEGAVFGEVEMTTGHARKERQWTESDRIVPVEWRITSQARMTALDNWYEVSLRAGQEQFSARVANQGAGFLWWTAQWVESWEAQALDGGRWHVVGKLLLTGEGSADPPVMPSLAIEFSAALRIDVASTVGRSLAIEFVCALNSGLSLEIEFEAALLADGNFELREDGGYELREDGGIELRE